MAKLEIKKKLKLINPCGWVSLFTKNVNSGNKNNKLIT